MDRRATIPGFVVLFVAALTWGAVSVIAPPQLAHADEEDPAELEPEPMEAFGAISKRKGKALSVALNEGQEPPAKGTTATLSKYFEKEFAGAKMSGWLEIAEVTVTKSAASLSLRIDKELSEVVVDGKKVNHFKTGNKVKLTWTGE